MACFWMSAAKSLLTVTLLQTLIPVIQAMPLNYELSAYINQNIQPTIKNGAQLQQLYKQNSKYSMNDILLWQSTTPSLSQLLKSRPQSQTYTSDTDSKLMSAMRKVMQIDSLQTGEADIPNIGDSLLQRPRPQQQDELKGVASNRQRHYQCLVHVINCFW